MSLCVGHIHYESPFGCLVAFGNHPETIDVNLHLSWVGLDNPTIGPIPWLGTLSPLMDFWMQTSYCSWLYSTLPSFIRLHEPLFSGPVTQTQHTRGRGVPESVYSKPQPSVWLPPGRPPPKGEVPVGAAFGFPTSLSPPY